MITAGQQTATRTPAFRRASRSFMEPGELALLRRTVIKVTQQMLAQELVHPDDGLPIAACTLSLYESGARPVPLWAARRLREFAACARAYDAKHSLS